ncbi:hypothetical protein PLESTB_000282600 [Pleodorina starrii]|uniref:Ion transport domain-containing protein n=1 Tax=Pleodorina starrii TaxID=330485 RepID=A0A9W6BDT0_9CHLO|nr:hypothetical protein PLESTM_001406900 [Pleodorina starrii]GLC49747.1 hypothetical protein PLESTB_000282600 [Pleodorina starrii]GLC76049.1 hypothetical protein PLESTF_001724600 [Pleodorina starrii]
MSVKSPATLASEGSCGWRRSPQNTDYQIWIPASNARLTSCDLLTLPKVGEALLVAGNENQISLWDISNGRLLWRYSAAQLETAQKSSMQLRQSTITACKAISGNAFCTSNAEGSVHLWNLVKEPGDYGGWYATCVAQENGHTAEVTGMSVYLNGTRIMTTSKDFTVRIWDTSDMSVVRTFEEHYCEVYGSAVTEDGTRAITSGQLEPESSSVIIWEPDTGKVLHTPTDHSGWLDVAAISGPAGLAAVTGVHGILFVWDIESGVQQYRTKFNHGSRSCCRFSQCGMFLLVGGYDLGELVLLESRYGQELLRVHTSQEPGTFNTLTGCFFLSESPSRVSLSSSGAGSGGSPAKSGGGTFGARSNGGSSVKDSPSKSTGYTCGPASDVGAGGGGGGGGYHAGSPHMGFSERYYSIDREERKAMELRRAEAIAASRCSPSSIGSVSSVTSSNRLGYKGRRSGRLGRSSSRVVPEASARFSFPTRFGAVCTDGSIRVFNMEGDSFDDALWRDERMQDVYDVDVSRDATLMFVIYKAGRFQEELHLYDFSTGEFVWNYPRAHEGTYGLYLVASSDAGLVAGGGGSGEARPMRGKMITTGGDRKVRVFDLAKRQMIRLIDTAHTQDIVSPQMNARFDQMLTTCDGWDAWTCLWDLNTGQMLRKYDKVHNEGIYDAWFTPDDLRCVSVSCDKTAAIFDLASGDVIQRFVGHEHWVRFAALSPDEKVLATASNDNTVRIWNAAKGNQLHVIRDHRGTLSWINFVHPTWIVTSARDGTIVGFNLKSGVSVPLLVAGPIGKADGAEKIRSMPLSAGVAGPRFPPVLAISLNARAVVLHLSVRQPMPQQLLAEMKSGLWDLEHVKKLADTFPGLAVVPLPDGNTLLHTAAVGGQVEFLRVLLNHGGAIASAPLPANGDGKTPLDLALDVRNLQCVELLLANEVTRPPPLRLAAMKAWSRLAADMPAVLVKFLNAVGIEEPTDAVGSSAVMVPVREGVHLITCGSQKFEVDEKLWEEVLQQHGAVGSDDEDAALSDVPEEEREREGGEAAGEDASAPLRAGNARNSGDGGGAASGRRRQRRGVLPSAWRWARRWLRDESPSVLQPAVPGVCGLPYVALTTRSMADSPLGALVLNNVSDAFTTDIGFAMLTYKWDTYAGAIYRQQGLVYGIFMVMYILATTLGLQWNPHVDREGMYEAHRGRAVVRILLESGVLLLNARYLMEEMRQIWRHGPLQYFTGHNSAWNWVELLSCVMVNLVVLLQLLEVEAARWVMSACTILLGTRLLKVASGSEGTGIFVQVIIRIIGDLRHYLLIVGVTLLTFALAFRQITVYFEQMSSGAGVSDDFTKNFDTFPDSLLSVYYFMTVGGFSTDVGGEAKYVWYLHVLLISFSFMVSIILLNLLIAVMSDTYVVVKQHAKSEWMLLKARLVLEIDSNMPDSFFADRRRSAPRWLHVVNTKRTSSPAHASLLDSIRGTVVRQALNTDLTDTKHEIKAQIASLTEQLQSLQRDITRLSEALSGGGPDRIDARTPIQQVGATTAAAAGGAAAAAFAEAAVAGGMPLMTRSLSRRPESFDERAAAAEGDAALSEALPGALPGAPEVRPSESS